MVYQINSPLLWVKVPENSYRVANELGLLNEFLFYCTIKTSNIEGVLKRGKIIPLLKEKTGLSESNIRLKLSQLCQLNWIKRDALGNVTVLKYDVVWNSLGIVKEVRDGKKLFRIKSSNLKGIKSEIEVKEIKDCLLKQSFTVRSSFLKEYGVEDTERKPSVLLKIRKRNSNTIDFSKLFFYRIKRILINPINSVNYDISLSCLGVARLLGYKSSMQGCNIEKKLKKEGLLGVERRLIYIGKFSYFAELPTGCFVSKNGKILKQLPNKLTPLI